MENNQALHPTVAEFKDFINQHPALIKEIRKSGRSWQEYYEKWVLLGEDDPYWDEFKNKETEGKEKRSNGKSDEKNFELFHQLLKATENIDMDKIQNQVSNLSNTITTVQELINQFQHSKNEQVKKGPFDMFRD